MRLSSTDFSLWVSIELGGIQVLSEISASSGPLILSHAFSPGSLTKSHRLKSVLLERLHKS